MIPELIVRQMNFPQWVEFPKFILAERSVCLSHKLKVRFEHLVFWNQGEYIQFITVSVTRKTGLYLSDRCLDSSQKSVVKETQALLASPTASILQYMITCPNHLGIQSF